MPRRLTSALLAIAAALACAAQAGAATVSFTTNTIFIPAMPPKSPETTTVTQTLTIVAAPGESNRLAVSLAGDGDHVTDAGAALQAGEGCSSQPDGSVLCPRQTFSTRYVKAQLGDGDDTAELTSELGFRSFGTSVDGGPGDDVMSADGGTLLGADGADRLTLTAAGTLDGGAGADTLTGSPLADVIDGGAGTDLLEGGDGLDMLSYAGLPEAIAVDLAAATAGAPGEEDHIAGFERARGGEGPDLLRAGTGATVLEGGGGDELVGSPENDALDGGDGADRMSGGAGRDLLNAGPGDDALAGGDGPDRLWPYGGTDVADGGAGRDEIEDLELRDGPSFPDSFAGGPGDDKIYGGRSDAVDGGEGDDEIYGGTLSGGPGNDRIQGPRRARHAVGLDCGPGRDRLIRPAFRVLLPPGCEGVEPWFFGGAVARVPPRLRDGALRLALRSPCLDLPCRVEGALFLDGRRVGTATAPRPFARRRVLRWELTRAERRLFLRGALLQVRLVKRERRERAERGGYTVRLG